MTGLTSVGSTRSQRVASCTWNVYEVRIRIDPWRHTLLVLWQLDLIVFASFRRPIPGLNLCFSSILLHDEDVIVYLAGIVA